MFVLQVQIRNHYLENFSKINLTITEIIRKL